MHRQWLIYRRADLNAAIAHEQALGRNTGLLHAARRAVALLDELINEQSTDGPVTIG